MTMHHIASFAANGSSGSVDFTSIPQTFTHLQVRMFGRSSSATTNFPFFIASNLNTGTCWWHSLIGNGTAASPSNYSQGGMYTLDGPAASSTANVFGSVIVDIPDYTNTSKRKTFKSIAGYDANGSGIVRFTSYAEGGTGAITSINISTVGAGNFVTGSRFDLYGITSNTIATGA
jgi:hypothetical protein